MTQTTSPKMATLLDALTYRIVGTYTPNRWGGADITSYGATLRVTEDDGQIALRTFTGGVAMRLGAEVTFNHTPAQVIASTASALWDTLSTL